MRAPLFLLLFAAPAFAEVDIQKSAFDSSSLLLDVTTDKVSPPPDFLVTIDGNPVSPSKVTQHAGGFTIAIGVEKLPGDGKSHDVVVAVGDDLSKPDAVVMPTTRASAPPAPVRAPPEPPEAILPPKKFELQAGGYVQPQFRLRQDAPGIQDSLNGFRLTRARGIAMGTVHFDGASHIDALGYLEANFGSATQLLDAYVALRGDFPMDARAGWRIRLGQQYTPFSRQTFLSDVESQLPEKSQLTQQPTTTESVVPWRQLGLSATANIPYVPWVELSAGAFNGKGINDLENTGDSNLMYVGRLAIRPFAPRAPITEGPFGPDQLSIAIDGAISKQDLGAPLSETHKWIGIDGFFSWRGLSGEFEWVKARHEPASSDKTMAAPPSFGQQGLNLQLGYLLPFLGKHLEISGRVEEIDRNDTAAIARPGDANQSLRLYWVCVTWYQLQHNLKLQLAGVHVDEIENKTATGMNATFPNDFILLQATLRYL